MSPKKNIQQPSAILFVITFVALLGLMFVPAITQAASLYISPIDTRASEGEQLDVSLWLKTEGMAIDDVEVVITFPEDSLTLESVTPLEPFGLSSDDEVTDESVEGEVRFRMISLQPVDKDSVVAVLSFRASEEGNGRIFLENQTRVRSGGQSVPLQVMGSRIQITSKASSSGEIEEDQDRPDDETIDVPDDVSIQNRIDDEASIFRAEDPEIRGRTSEPYATVEIRVDDGLVSDRVRSDADGEWVWRLPSALLPGRYYVDIRAVHPTFDDVVSDSAVALLDRVLYDVAVTQYSIEIDGPYLAEPGGTASFEIKFLHDGSTEDWQIQTPLRVTYRLFDSAFIDMYEEEEDRLIIGAETVVIKTVHVPQDAVEGEYTFMVGAMLGEQALYDQRFDVLVKVPLRKRILAVRKWIIVIGIVFVGILSGYIFHTRKRARTARVKKDSKTTPLSKRKKTATTSQSVARKRKPGAKKPTRKKPGTKRPPKKE